MRRYNGTEASEVAAFIPGNEDGGIDRRDIVVRRRGTLNSDGNKVLDPNSANHRAYDPLSYVLLVRNGRDGWYPELRFSSVHDGRRTMITPMMDYGWHLLERAGGFSTILHAARLFQQYSVDQFCEVEAKSFRISATTRRSFERRTKLHCTIA